MQPLWIRLKGFRGIRDGLGREELTLDLERMTDGATLVAIVGANGRGKTTLMDCLHPYLLMPSRLSGTSTGGFSFYDHVYLPQNEKELVWAHEGRSYRSHIVIRLGSRNVTEAYLFEMTEAGAWQPVHLADGTCSDGKTKTYAQCVEAICGSADTFFTSVFAAQGKRPLHLYQNAEIKTLLADLLGQDDILAEGARAAKVASQLKAGLTVMRAEQANHSSELARLEQEGVRLGDVTAKASRCEQRHQSAQAIREKALTEHARMAALQEQSRGVEQRRTQLQFDAQTLALQSRQAFTGFDEQEQGEQLRLARLDKRVAERQTKVKQQRDRLQVQLAQLAEILSQSSMVVHASRRLPLAKAILAIRQERLSVLLAQGQRLRDCEAAHRAAVQQLAGIEREAGQAALAAEDLARRVGLTREVPCAGTDLQGRCQLLGDARDAQALIPRATADMGRLTQEKAAVQQSIQTLVLEQDALRTETGALPWVQRRLQQAENRVRQWSMWAARSGEMARARTQHALVEQELTAMENATSSVSAGTQETAEEAHERQQCELTLASIMKARIERTDQDRKARRRIDASLSALPAPFDDQALAAAQHALQEAEGAVLAAQQAQLAAIRDVEALAALARNKGMVLQRQRVVCKRMENLQTQLSAWNLLARCLSPDGVIALAIDDSGPALASLASDLLLACYGPRFTVSLRTQVETAKGEQREGFEILVYDGACGESKPLALMSGGERVWINEALVRAVALYLAHHTGRHHECLFTDEVDGPLDLHRKRMFMAMKREVLRLGGYEREYFVSQTPELTSMADVVIDLDALMLVEPVSAQ